ncbi:MAG: threonine/serine exporter family protein [Ruminococcaceae bacterium]|nr:threonine/serine exporter family protein [Oscillospiraceae bacterium]
MEYSKLLDLATDLGYNLAMNGAETFRVEESITRVLDAYGIESESFVIPNCMHISIEPVIGRPLTRMRRIGLHGNDLDAVEQFSNLSRRICQERPAPEIAAKWLEETKAHLRTYSFPWYLAGNFLGALGFALLFGGDLKDSLLAGLCGIIIGLISRWMERLGANQFFRTIAAALPMALVAYIANMFFPSVRSDAVVIGALMLLVPGLLFTNAMRDIIYGDTNSGINRIVQVLLIAVAIALGAAFAWNFTSLIWQHPPVTPPPVSYPFPSDCFVCKLLLECFACAIGCVGFAILFNIHGPGVFLCMLGGMLAWAVYAICLALGISEIGAYFWGAAIASAYSEVMARIRKYPAISYLVISIFPLIPGSGVYYTMQYAVKGEMELFASKGMVTAAIAGVMALGILLVSTCVRLWSNGRRLKKR